MTKLEVLIQDRPGQQSIGWVQGTKPLPCCWESGVNLDSTQKPQVLPYLEFDGPRNFDINLNVCLTPSDGEENVICQSNFGHMYWNMAQQLTHHTVNGCNVRVGDLLASGTISGPEPSSFGSMLELSWGGTKPLTLKDGCQRTFLEDYDTITLHGWAEKPGIKVGFGEVRTKILPTIYE